MDPSAPPLPTEEVKPGFRKRIPINDIKGGSGTSAETFRERSRRGKSRQSFPMIKLRHCWSRAMIKDAAPAKKGSGRFTRISFRRVSIPHDACFPSSRPGPGNAAAPIQPSDPEVRWADAGRGQRSAALKPRGRSFRGTGTLRIQTPPSDYSAHHSRPSLPGRAAAASILTSFRRSAPAKLGDEPDPSSRVSRGPCRRIVYHKIRRPPG